MTESVVSFVQMAGMVLQMSLALLVPVGIIVLLARRKQFSWKAFGAGALVFFLFSQVLEKLLHVVVLDASGPSLKWTDSVVAFVAYGTLAAGVFEEGGRYLAFRFMLRNNREYRDGLSLGLGHGGLEAVLIGVLAGVNALVLAFLINSGQWDQAMQALPAEQAARIREQLLDTGFWMYALGGLERVAALAIQIALSLLVLAGVRNGRFRYVVYAVLLHAGVDVLPALYQKGVLTDIWVVEAVIMVYAVMAVFFIRRSRKYF